jgi:hypothetical protein
MISRGPKAVKVGLVFFRYASYIARGMPYPCVGASFPPRSEATLSQKIRDGG